MTSPTTFRAHLGGDPVAAGPQLSGSWQRWGNSGQERFFACESGVALTEGEAQRASELLIQGDAESVFRAQTASMVVVDPAMRSAVVACHPSGTHPLFLRTTRDSVIVGNSITAVAGPNPEPDSAGILQHLCWGWTVGRRTLLRDVHRVDPGAVVTLAVAPGGVRVETTTVPWHLNPSQTADGVPDFWDSLEAAISLPESGKVAVMMSGGWDSRTVLAALLRKVSTDRVLLYSHGNPESRELAIVRAIGRTLGCAVHLEPITPDPFSLPAVADGFVRTENVLFPHWHAAARRLKTLGVTRTYTGVFGELVGGRYGTTTEGSFAQKVLATFLPQLGGKVAPSQVVNEVLSRFERTLPTSRPWFLTQEFWASAQLELDEIRTECREWLGHEFTRHNPTLGGLMEAFYLKHRAGQYAGAQPRSFLGQSDWASPMASLDCIRSGAALDFGSRVQNRRNRQMLRQNDPRVLGPSTAACLIPARYPIPLQEASRAFRKVAQALAQYGRPGRPIALSWNDFSFLKNSGALEQIVGTFSSRIIDQKAVRQRVAAGNTSQGGNLHSLADMMLKIANVEWSLNPDAIGAGRNPSG